MPVAVYEYRRASGDVAFVNARFEPKDFRAAHPTPNGRWAWNLHGAPTLLYALPHIEQALREGERIWIVDGEKDADALNFHGAYATCCARSQGWSLDLAEQLIGARWVRIVADWDGGRGLEQAREVRDLLLQTTGLGSNDIEIVRAVEGKDAHDHLTAGHGLDEFVLVDEDVALKADEPAAVIAETFREFELRALPPSESLVGAPRDGTNLLPRYGWVMPWGPAGSGKTSILVDLLFHACGGIDWLGYHVERPLRILAIVNEGIPGALQDKLIQKRERWEHDTEIVRDNLAVFVSPWGEFTFRDERLVNYARDYARDFGADYVALDPLHTVSTVSAGAPDETERFKHELRAFGVWNDLGVITAHHSNKMGMISGDWARHADTVLHIEKVPKVPASKFTLQKARPADPMELGVPCLLNWLTETFGYERVQLEAVHTDDSELLDRIKQTLATATEPLSMRRLREGTKGSGDRLSEIAQAAIERGEILNVSTSKGRYLLVLAERSADFGEPSEPLRLDEALLGMVEPDERFVASNEPQEPALEVEGTVRGSSPSTEGANLDEPNRGDDAGSDNPFLEGRP